MSLEEQEVCLFSTPAVCWHLHCLLNHIFSCIVVAIRGTEIFKLFVGTSGRLGKRDLVFFAYKTGATLSMKVYFCPQKYYPRIKIEALLST